MQNLSCENEFYLHDNKKSFPQERFCTWPRFKTEACGISEMAYFENFQNITRAHKSRNALAFIRIPILIDTSLITLIIFSEILSSFN